MYWIEVFFLFTIAYLCAVFYLKWKFKFWERKGVPHPKPNFPMGNLEQPWAIKKGFHQIIAEIYHQFKNQRYKYGGIFTSLRPSLLIIDLDLARNVLIKDFHYFVDRGLYYNEKDDPISAHLLAVGGERWKRLRHKLSPTFTSGKMKSMFPLVAQCGHGLEMEIGKLWEKNNPVDIREMAALFTTNVIGTCAFGLDCNCFENPDNEFRIQAKKVLNSNLGATFKLHATHGFPNLCRKLRVKAVPESASKFFRSVIEDIVDHRTTKGITKNDFVELLLDINKNAERKEESLTFDEMSAQAFVFFIAGFETSSSTMAFAFYEMAKQQKIQDKVREEIRLVLAKDSGRLTYENITEMTYMGQVLDETLRMYPIAATTIRECTQDYKIPGEDLVLKEGTRIVIPLLGVHHDPEYYPNPERFDPERFMPEKKATLHPCAYMPFGVGPRTCIGMRFGIMQAKVGMAIMLKDYKYTLNAETPEMQLNGKSFLISPAGDVLLDIERIY